MELKGSSSILSVFSVLTVIVALQTTVLFTVMACKHCRHRTKGTPASDNNERGMRAPAGVEEKVYEPIELEEGNTVQKKASGRGTIQLNKNSSYGVHLK